MQVAFKELESTVRKKKLKLKTKKKNEFIQVDCGQVLDNLREKAILVGIRNFCSQLLQNGGLFLLGWHAELKFLKKFKRY